MHRHLYRVAFAVAVTAGGLTAQPVPDQTAELLGHFDRNSDQLEALVRGLSSTQWHFKPAPDRWSVAKVVEHIVANEEWTYGLMSSNITERDVTEEIRRTATQQENMIRATFRDRSQRFPAPANLEPTGRYGSDSSQLLEAFRSHRRAWSDFVRGADFDLRRRVAPHPIIGPIDTHQWATAAVEHGNRHLEQIREVLADPEFPGR
jgi:hypothetical protein